MYQEKRFTILVAVGFAIACGPAQGYLAFTNQAPEGASWFTAENWRNTESPYGNAVPTATDICRITDLGFGTAIVDGPGAVAKTLHLGRGDGLSLPGNLIIQPGGELSVSGQSYVGFDSPAQLVIMGGMLKLGQLIIGYLPSSGGLPCKMEVVQYAGNVILTNKTSDITLNGNADAQNYATGYPRYRLVGGMISAPYMQIGSSGYGKFEAEGGTNAVGTVRLGWSPGGDGVYLQSGGLLDAYNLQIGRPGAKGHYELSAGSCNVKADLWCGSGGKGTFVQSGGTNTPMNFTIGGYETGTGHYQISGGKLAINGQLRISTNGTLKIVGNQADVSFARYAQTEQSTLDLYLTNGVVSPIAVRWGHQVKLAGTLNLTLLGSPDSYPDRSSVISLITAPEGTPIVTEFTTINLAPAHRFLDVRITYEDHKITLDQWKYAPNGTLMTIR